MKYLNRNTIVACVAALGLPLMACGDSDSGSANGSADDSGESSSTNESTNGSTDNGGENGSAEGGDAGGGENGSADDGDGDENGGARGNGNDGGASNNGGGDSGDYCKLATPDALSFYDKDSPMISIEGIRKASGHVHEIADVAPDEIADDWNAFAEMTDRQVSFMEEHNLRDITEFDKVPKERDELAAELEAEYGGRKGIKEITDRMMAHLKDECNIKQN